MDLLAVNSGPPDYRRPEWFLEKLRQGLLRELITQCEGVVEERLRLFGLQHSDVAFAYDLLAYARKEMLDIAEWGQASERHLEAVRGVWGESSWQFAVALNNLGCAHISANRL